MVTVRPKRSAKCVCNSHYAFWPDVGGFYEPLDKGTKWAGLDIHTLIVSNNETHLTVRVRLNEEGTADPTLLVCMSHNTRLEFSVYNAQGPVTAAKARLYYNGTSSSSSGPVKWINKTYASWTVPHSAYQGAMDSEIEVQVNILLNLDTPEGNIQNHIDTFYLSGTSNGYHFLTDNLPEPVVEIISPANHSYIGNTNITLQWQPTGAAIEQYEIYLNSTLTDIFYSPATSYTMILPEGNNYITIKAMSYTGLQTTALLDVYVDLTSPEVNILPLKIKLIIIQNEKLIPFVVFIILHCSKYTRTN